MREWKSKLWRCFQNETTGRLRRAGWRLTSELDKPLSGFGDFTGLDARGADFHPASATLRHLHADGLQIWIEASRRAIVRVRDIVAELRSLAADFATFSHLFQPPN